MNLILQAIKSMFRGVYNAIEASRTCWEETKEVILVDSYTSAEYQEGINLPSCNFVPKQKYNVTWNGVLYENIVCYTDGEFNILGGDGSGYPFYLDDDGGNAFYVGCEEDEEFTVSVSTIATVVHKLDKKYLPDNMATVEAVQEAQTTADNAQTTADNAQTTAESKMDAENPVGTGSFSIGRQSDSTIGYNSTAHGDGTVANFADMRATGKYNLFDDVVEVIKKDVTADYGMYFQTLMSTSYSFDTETNRYIINPGGIYKNVEDLPASGGYYIYVPVYNSVLLIRSEMIYVHSIVKISDGKYHILGDLYRIVSKGTEQGKYIHVVGNGTSDEDRSNAHTLDWEGNAWYAGDVYVGGDSGTDRDEGSKKLATEEKVTEIAIPTPSTATVGQTIRVKEVDADGKPTTWESADYQPRTHWTDSTVIASDAPVTFSEGTGIFYASYILTELPSDVKYKVTVNGVSEILTATDSILVSDRYALSPNGTDDGDWLFMYLDGSTTETTVSVEMLTVNQIPEMYIPNVATKFIDCFLDGDTQEDDEGNLYRKITADTVTFLKAYEWMNNGFPVYVRFAENILQDISAIQIVQLTLSASNMETGRMVFSGVGRGLFGLLEYRCLFEVTEENTAVSVMSGTLYHKIVSDITEGTAMTGATADSDGKFGYVPTPYAGDHTKFLRGDGTWADVQSGGDSPITFVENTDSTNKVPLRTLASGTYMLKGYFTSYEGGTHSYTFSTGMLVAIVKQSSTSYVQIFYPKNNTIQYLEITDDSVMRQDAKLINMESVANMVTQVNEDSDDSHYPSAKAVETRITEVLPSLMQGATADTNGGSGIVPQPLAGEHEKFLRGDGTWADVPSGGARLLVDYITEEETLNSTTGFVEFTTDTNGNPLAVKNCLIKISGTVINNTDTDSSLRIMFSSKDGRIWREFYCKPLNTPFVMFVFASIDEDGLLYTISQHKSTNITSELVDTSTLNKATIIDKLCICSNNATKTHLASGAHIQAWEVL